MFRGEKLFGRKGLPAGSPMASEAPASTRPTTSPSASSSTTTTTFAATTSGAPNTSSTVPKVRSDAATGDADGLDYGDGYDRGAYDYEEKLRAFIGPNADVYIDLKRRKEHKANANKFCWGAFFAPMVWLFYRKLYIEGIAIFLVPLVLFFIFPGLDMSGAVISVLIGMMGVSYYLGRAEKKIKDIESANLSPQDEALLLEKSGGVSVAGAWFAGIFNVMIIGLYVLLVTAQGAAQ